MLAGCGEWDAEAAGESVNLHGGAAALIASQRVCAGSLSRTERQSPASHPDGHALAAASPGSTPALPLESCPRLLRDPALSAPPFPDALAAVGLWRAHSLSSLWPRHPLTHLHQFQTVSLGEKGLEASQPKGLELSAPSWGLGGKETGGDPGVPSGASRGRNREGPRGNCRGLPEGHSQGAWKRPWGLPVPSPLRGRTWSPQVPRPPVPSRPSARKVWFQALALQWPPGSPEVSRPTSDISLISLWQPLNLRTSCFAIIKRSETVP